jgi:hypothetical protein
MIPAVQFAVGDGVSEALRRLVASRESQQGTEGAVNMTMQFWVSFIMAKQSVASRPGIKERLMARAVNAKALSPVRRYNKKGTKESTAKRYLALRDTVAASIVWSTNYKNARAMTAQDFIATTGRFVAHRQYSAGYHKAGFRPALNEFRIRRGLLGVAPAYKAVNSTAIPARSISETIIEALVKNASAGAEKNPTGGIAAVIQSEAEVVAKLEKLTAQNIQERAAGLGFNRR